jgi:hypothetical protein
LKACIAKQVNQYDFPDRELANKSYSHELKDLIATAGLTKDLNDKMKVDKNFRVNRAVVKDWSD